MLGDSLPVPQFFFSEVCTALLRECKANAHMSKNQDFGYQLDN